MLHFHFTFSCLHKYLTQKAPQKASGVLMCCTNPSVCSCQMYKSGKHLLISSENSRSFSSASLLLVLKMAAHYLVH